VHSCLEQSARQFVGSCFLVVSQQLQHLFSAAAQEGYSNGGKLGFDGKLTEIR